MKKAVLVVFVFIFALISSASEIAPTDFLKNKKLKDLNRRAKYPIGVNVYAFGPVGLMAITGDWFLTPKVALELGAGIRDFDGNHAFTVGGRYHIFGNSFLNMTPYVGIYSAFHYNGSSLQNNSLYIPFGIHKIKKSKLSWSAEVAYQKNTFFSNRLVGGFRIGYRF